MRNNKGFTLIELIMVTIILGILAAVAIPRYMGTVNKAEVAAEEAVIDALRNAVEDYSMQMFIEHGRYEYPSNPFDLVDVDQYRGHHGAELTDDGDWHTQDEGVGFIKIRHRRSNNEVYLWGYKYDDHSDGDSDDRGINIGYGDLWNGWCENCGTGLSNND